MLNKLRCHAHFWFPANQITWSGFLIEIHIFNDKQCRSRSVTSSEANWSGSTLFAKTGHVVFSKRGVNSGGVLISNCLKIGILPYYKCWGRLTHCSLETSKRVIDKQCRHRSDAAFCGVWSGSSLFANNSTIFSLGISKSHSLTYLTCRPFKESWNFWLPENIKQLLWSACTFAQLMWVFAW